MDKIINLDGEVPKGMLLKILENRKAAKQAKD